MKRTRLISVVQELDNPGRLSVLIVLAPCELRHRDPALSHPSPPMMFCIFNAA